MRPRGLTLLEVVIGAAILVAVMGATYALLFASTKLGQSELALRDAQFQLHLRLDQISAEIRESKQQLVRVQTFTEAAIAQPNQSVLVLVSARNATEQFQVENALPQWQKLVVYAPYFNAGLNSVELRRYELSPIPSLFLDEASTPAIQVTPTQILLEDGTLERAEGRTLATRVDYFRVTENANSVRIDFSIGGDQVAGTKEVDLGSEVKGRN